MKAAVLWELGKAPKYEEFAKPVAGEGEALVRVRAASLKGVDRQLASGAHYASPREFPVVCGTDGVGGSDDCSAGGGAAEHGAYDLRNGGNSFARYSNGCDAASADAR